MEQSTHSLLQLIEKDKLVKIIESFTKATDITIDVNDAFGYPVVQHDYFYGFCQNIRSTDEGLKRCIHSNAELGFETLQQSTACMGKCHAGVMLMAVPIVVDGQFYGSITCGQMHLEQPSEEAVNYMLANTFDLGLDQVELARDFQYIQVISREKCQAAGGLIQFVVNYIIELVYGAKIQEELSREKLRAAEEARSRVELEHTLHKAELKNLQAQIKPHFLFNTLNTVTGLVTLGENEKGLSTLYALSSLMRHNLDHPGETVSLREELDYVQSYLLIQKNRFGERLQVLIEVPEDLLELQVPFLSLQPLVENACIHGLEPKEEAGHLWIRGKVLGEQVEISVIDDGKGGLAGCTSEERKEFSFGIGLHNVNRRLQLQFGKEFGVKSQRIRGLTTVSLIFPCSGYKLALV
jgi:two-component system, LytTR family, sensor kinase